MANLLALRDAKGLENIDVLAIGNCRNLTDLSGLEGVSNCDRLQTLAGLGPLTRLDGITVQDSQR